MRTMAILNLKGGVGKTVTAVNVAAVLAGEHRQRVLLIDADSQCNSTEFFAAEPAKGNLAEVLSAQTQYQGMYARSCIQETPFPGIDILAASDALMDLDLSKIEDRTVNSRAIFDMATAFNDLNLYDFMIIDCPPAFNAASAAALLAAQEVIIPIKLDAFSLRGMANLMRQVANMRKINANLRVAGCLATMWYKDEAIASAEHQLRSSGLPVFRTVIRRTSKVDRMTFAQQPLCIFSPRSSAGVDYRRFVREYIGGGLEDENK